jgi:hypothetical protein
MECVAMRLVRGELIVENHKTCLGSRKVFLVIYKQRFQTPLSGDWPALSQRDSNKEKVNS